LVVGPLGALGPPSNQRLPGPRGFLSGLGCATSPDHILLLSRRPRIALPSPAAARCCRSRLLLGFRPLLLLGPWSTRLHHLARGRLLPLQLAACTRKGVGSGDRMRAPGACQEGMKRSHSIRHRCQSRAPQRTGRRCHPTRLQSTRTWACLAAAAAAASASMTALAPGHPPAAAPAPAPAAFLAALLLHQPCCLLLLGPPARGRGVATKPRQCCTSCDDAAPSAAGSLSVSLPFLATPPRCQQAVC